jgi:hypothetical protein
MVSGFALSAASVVRDLMLSDPPELVRTIVPAGLALGGPPSTPGMLFFLLLCDRRCGTHSL